MNSFKYQGVMILNDLKNINIYQNKSKFWKELKSNYVAYLFRSNQILSTFCSSYPVATSVLIVESVEMHFTCRWSQKIICIIIFKYNIILFIVSRENL